MSDLIEDKVVDISLKQNTEYMMMKVSIENVPIMLKKQFLIMSPDGLIRIQLNDNVFLNIFDEGYIIMVVTLTPLVIIVNPNTFGIIVSIIPLLVVALPTPLVGNYNCY